ncbi:sensor histidine kinase [Actinomadura oligospora]|uniref:sensor histidine kinase n=1 Tax=Actinomadura oligospora TaxID=111804 RepID=UPI00047E4569|nr:sensor histidine kinase [Actinomadura oligospora]
MRSEPRPPLFRWVRAGHWQALDYLAAAACALMMPMSLWNHLRTPGTALLVLTATALVAGAVALRRRYPEAATTAMAVAFLLMLPVDGGAGVGPPVMATPYVLYSVASLRRPRTAFVALAVALTPVLAIAASPSRGMIVFAFLFVTVWTVGLAVGQHRSHTENLLRQQAARQAEQARAELHRAQRQVTEERLRIARELHDVVAHSMSVITVQAGFGHLVIDDDPAGARTALGVIETTGRDALREMRRLLGLLREEDPDPATQGPTRAPAPGLADLERLVTQTARAGVQVEVAITGQPRDLDAGIDLSAYRIIQEALTNVVKHSGTTTARAAIDYRTDELTIEVTDQGSGCATPPVHGHGLHGMRERVNLYGGSFRAAPLPGRGFQVAARLPLAEDPA